MNGSTTHLLVVEDHPIYSQGLIAAIERALPAVRCCGVGSAAAALARLEQPGAQIDLLLLDLKLPDRNGLALLAEVRRRWPTLACVLVTGVDDARAIEQALALGCVGYVPKSLEPAALVEALAGVLRGEPAVPPGAPPPSSAGISFTDRQRFVLQRVSQGLTSRAIAAELGIAERTVKDHLAVIYGRLDASTRAEAVARGAALGLIDLAR